MPADAQGRSDFTGDDSALSDLLAQGPARSTRRVLYGLALLALVCLVGASVWHFDVTVSAGGPHSRRAHLPHSAGDDGDRAQSPRLREGDLVQAGEELAELEADEVGVQSVRPGPCRRRPQRRPEGRGNRTSV